MYDFTFLRPKTLAEAVAALSADEDAMVRFTEATGQGGDWVPIAPKAGVPAWTDGFASILPVLKPFWERF